MPDSDYYGDDPVQKQNPEPWHIGREIPIAVLIVLLIQTGGAVWWASRVESQMQTISRQFERFDNERYTKEDARRDRELILQMFKTNELMLTQFDRRMALVESQHDAFRSRLDAKRP